MGIGGQDSLSAYIVRDLMQEGYFVNVSSYPSVPLKNEEIRIAISTHQTKEKIMPAFEMKEVKSNLVA